MGTKLEDPTPMPIPLRLLLTLVLLIATPALGSDNNWPWPLTQCARLLSGSKNPPPQVTISMDAIHPKVRRWFDLSARKKVYNAPKPLQRGDQAEFLTQRFPVLLVLGSGAEAGSYLVDTPEGIRVLKAFHKAGDEHFKPTVEVYKMSGGLLPRVIATDDARGILLLEYWEGVPVSEFRLRGLVLGLSEAESEMIQMRFSKWQFQQRQTPLGRPFCSTQSTLLKRIGFI